MKPTAANTSDIFWPIHLSDPTSRRDNLDAAHAIHPINTVGGVEMEGPLLLSCQETGDAASKANFYSPSYLEEPLNLEFTSKDWAAFDGRAADVESPIGSGSDSHPPCFSSQSATFEPPSVQRPSAGDPQETISPNSLVKDPTPSTSVLEIAHDCPSDISTACSPTASTTSSATIGTEEIHTLKRFRSPMRTRSKTNSRPHPSYLPYAARKPTKEVTEPPAKRRRLKHPQDILNTPRLIARSYHADADKHLLYKEVQSISKYTRTQQNESRDDSPSNSTLGGVQADTEPSTISSDDPAEKSMSVSTSKDNRLGPTEGPLENNSVQCETEMAENGQASQAMALDPPQVVERPHSASTPPASNQDQVPTNANTETDTAPLAELVKKGGAYGTVKDLRVNIITKHHKIYAPIPCRPRKITFYPSPIPFRPSHPPPPIVLPFLPLTLLTPSPFSERMASPLNVPSFLALEQAPDELQTPPTEASHESSVPVVHQPHVGVDQGAHAIATSETSEGPETAPSHAAVQSQPSTFDPDPTSPLQPPCCVPTIQTPPLTMPPTPKVTRKAPKAKAKAKRQPRTKAQWGSSPQTQTTPTTTSPTRIQESSGENPYPIAHDLNQMVTLSNEADGQDKWTQGPEARQDVFAPSWSQWYMSQQAVLMASAFAMTSVDSHRITNASTTKRTEPRCYQSEKEGHPGASLFLT
ncbi:hypothetical protein ONZ45_g8449 [Pleurotus djamor]|nr:hypothetical protein ONZ45_g8449 [Pleurotus djamor]